jgi:hypothetical protein
MYPPEEMPPPSNTSHSQGFWGVVPWLRWLLIPYLLVVVLCGFFTIVIAGYGLAHASEESTSAFLLSILVVMIIVAIPPFALLLKSKALWARILQVIGMLVLAAVGLVFGKLIFYLFIQPAFWAKRYEATVAPIKIESVTEAPYFMGDTQIGLRLSTRVRLPKAIALDRYGDSVLHALQDTQLSAPELRGNNRMAPFEDLGSQHVQVSYAGKPLDQLPGVKTYLGRSYGLIPDGKTKLPAGIYQIDEVFWFNGLRASDPSSQDLNPTPCKLAPLQNQYSAELEKHLEETSNTPLMVNIYGRFSLGDRRGYRGFTRTAPLKYRYQHRQWKQTLANLSLTSCKVLDDAKKAAEDLKQAARDAEQRKRDYQRGTIAMADNPLHQETCAGQLDKVKARIAFEKNTDGAWIPNFNLSDIITTCTITKSQIALFEQLMPALYARAQAGFEAEGYCSVLDTLHSHRNLPFLQSLANMKLPIDCPNKELWRKGLVPIVEGTNSYDPSEQPARVEDATKRNDGLAWITFLKQQEIDICKPKIISYMNPEQIAKQANTKTLLDELTRHFDADMIAAVIDAGCDPNKVPSDANNSILEQEDNLPASVWWLFRRHRNENDSATSSLDKQEKELLLKLDRLMAPNADTLNAPSQLNPIGVLSIANRRILQDSQPELLAALVKHGVQLDRAHQDGYSWFFPGYGNDWSTQDVTHYLAILDTLSNVQLKQLIEPKIIGTGVEGKHMNLLDKPVYDFEKHHLRHYACKRKVMHCD